MNEIDNYIGTFPIEIQEKLIEINNIIRNLLPMASEKMSYSIPTYYYHENVVHFAGYKKHVGFYPTPSAIAAFENEISKYKYAKGSVQFPHDMPLPEDLIARMVTYRLDEIEKKYKIK